MSKELDYIADLERENRLLGERCNQLLKDKGNLTDELDERTKDLLNANHRIGQLEQQIEKMEVEEQKKKVEYWISRSCDYGNEIYYIKEHLLDDSQKKKLAEWEREHRND